MQAHSKRLFLIFLFLSLAFVLLSLLVVWFYRPTPPVQSPDWVESRSVTAPALSDGRKQETYNLLLVGRDRASAATDVMMLLSYDVPKQTVAMLQFPRDTLVRLHGNAQKLNGVFAAAKQAAIRSGATDSQGDLAAVRALGDFLGDALCLAVDYHALVYLDGFVDLVNHVGGVTLQVPFDMHYDDPTQNLHIHLQAGEQHLNGAQAEQFIRFRKGNNGVGYPMGDLGRLQTQKQFVSALFSRCKQCVSVSNLPGMMKDALALVKSDLTLSDSVYFGKHALSVSEENLILHTLPGSVVGNDYVMNKSGALALLNHYFNVYNTPIPSRAFDAKEQFNLPDNSRVNARYHEDGTSADVILEAPSHNEPIYLFSSAVADKEGELQWKIQKNLPCAL